MKVELLFLHGYGIVALACVKDRLYFFTKRWSNLQGRRTAEFQTQLYWVSSLLRKHEVLS